MNKIIIYTKTTCPYCIEAKALLNNKGQVYQEIKIDNNESLRKEMIVKANGRMTVPQIFINDIHIGGCDDLHKLEREGKLDKILG